LVPPRLILTDIWNSFIGDKAVLAWIWPFTSVYCRGLEYVGQKSRDNFIFVVIVIIHFHQQQCHGTS
jgi:hypothetical protein